MKRIKRIWRNPRWKYPILMGSAWVGAGLSLFVFHTFPVIALTVMFWAASDCYRDLSNAYKEIHRLRRELRSAMSYRQCQNKWKPEDDDLLDSVLWAVGGLNVRPEHFKKQKDFIDAEEVEERGELPPGTDR